MKILIVADQQSVVLDQIKLALSDDHEVTVINLTDHLRTVPVTIRSDLVLNLIPPGVWDKFNFWAHASGYESYWSIADQSNFGRHLCDPSYYPIKEHTVFFCPTKDMDYFRTPLYDLMTTSQMGSQATLGQDFPYYYTSGTAQADGFKRFRTYVAETVKLLITLDRARTKYMFWDRDITTTYNTEYKKLCKDQHLIPVATQSTYPVLTISNPAECSVLVIAAEDVKEVKDESTEV